MFLLKRMYFRSGRSQTSQNSQLGKCLGKRSQQHMINTTRRIKAYIFLRETSTTVRTKPVNVTITNQWVIKSKEKISQKFKEIDKIVN